jgi:hypothetical protein
VMHGQIQYLHNYYHFELESYIKSGLINVTKDSHTHSPSACRCTCIFVVINVKIDCIIISPWWGL